jgi:hypothetical protein
MFAASYSGKWGDYEIDDASSEAPDDSTAADE